MRDLEEIERLVGNAPRPGSIEDISAVLEANLEWIFEKFDHGKVGDRIREAVNQAVEAAMERASATTNPNMTKQFTDLKAQVGALRSQLADAIKALHDAAGGRGGGKRGGGATNSRSSAGASSVSDADTALQIRKKENMLTWKAGMKFNSNWNGQQRTNYSCLLKACDPDEHKRQ